MHNRIKLSALFDDEEQAVGFRVFNYAGIDFSASFQQIGNRNFTPRAPLPLLLFRAPPKQNSSVLAAPCSRKRTQRDKKSVSALIFGNDSA